MQLDSDSNNMHALISYLERILPKFLCMHVVGELNSKKIDIAAMQLVVGHMHVPAVSFLVLLTCASFVKITLAVIFALHIELQ